MVKTMVSCRFSLKPIHCQYAWDVTSNQAELTVTGYQTGTYPDGWFLIDARKEEPWCSSISGKPKVCGWDLGLGSRSRSHLWIMNDHMVPLIWNPSPNHENRFQKTSEIGSFEKPPGGRLSVGKNHIRNPNSCSCWGWTQSWNPWFFSRRRRRVKKKPTPGLISAGSLYFGPLGIMNCNWFDYVGCYPILYIHYMYNIPQECSWMLDY